ncbi:MAG: InlB B-repeat-containing protein [Treponema sp.]
MNKFFRSSVYTLVFAAILMVGCKQPTVSAQSKEEGGAKTFTVRFDLNGKEVKEGSTAPSAQYIKDGETATKPEVFEITDDNYAFEYWASDKEGNVRYDFSTAVTQSITLYAVYTEAVVVTLKYHNTSSDGTAKAKKDGTVLVAFNPHKTNALFKHWSTTENGEKVTQITAPITLHAVYYEINSSQKRINAIQGTSHTSPENTKAVTTVPGVVTACNYSKGSKNGFYMQDLDADTNPATSEGIYVYCGNNMPDVAVGDAVTVSGTVDEYAYVDKKNNNKGKNKKGKNKKATAPAQESTDLSVTQIKITKKEDVSVISHNNRLPEPVELTADAFVKDIFKASLESLDPVNEVIDYYESLEGMRVKIPQPKIVASPYKNTQYLAPKGTPEEWFTQRGGIILPDNYEKSTPCIRMYPLSCFQEAASAGVVEVAAGDSYTGDIIGVMGYAFSNYQVQLTEKLPAVTRGNITSERSTITFDASKLNIVSYNLENFSIGNTDKSHASRKLAPARAEGFAKHLVTDMKSPDIICLIEIQDDSSGTNDKTVSSEKTLQLLIDKMKGINSSLDYKPLWINPEDNQDGGAPGANIRCAYLYNAARIALMPDADNQQTLATATTVEATVENGGMKLTENPARIGIKDSSFANTRKSLVAHFKVIAEGSMKDKDFFVINNHLSSKRGDNPVWGRNQPVKRDSETNRHKQADAVVKFIKAVTDKRSNAAIISVGDYNDFWFSETIKKFKEAGMKNVIEELEKTERYTYVYNGHSQTLDNILVTNNISIHNPDVLHINAELPATTRLSDHDPVFVQLSW